MTREIRNRKFAIKIAKNMGLRSQAVQEQTRYSNLSLSIYIDRVKGCRRVRHMGSKSVEELIEASSGVHFSGFHLDGTGGKQFSAGGTNNFSS
ncbi:hypothetical protein F0562_009946 [Nyssa sinensis]|uniref:Uncharacterized protein n=1 Tax=Nyssa sinensis TaxID=561372 RepID=A0A5J4ZXH9_9ASTE|nr:hypothetical protein F0562_009946 [Nyssa sinensis]